MPRTSRSKSHRQHRRNTSRGDARERSDSDSEEERRRDYAVVSSSGTRDSRLGKRKGGLFLQGSEEGNGVKVGKHGEKSLDLFVAVNRLGGEDWRDDGDEVRVDDDKVAVAVEKTTGSGGGDWKENSILRHDAPGGRKERSSSDWDESTKRRSEQDLCWSDRGNQHGDVKERDRERLSDKDRGYLVERNKDHDAKKDKERELEKVRQHRSEKDRKHREEPNGEHRLKRSREQVDDMDREHDLEREAAVIQRDRSNDPSNKKSGSRLGDGEYTVKCNQENTYRWEHEELHNSDLDKDMLKKVRWRDYYVDKEKHYEEDRETEKKLSSIDDCVRSSSYKDEKYREERYKEKHQENFDRDEKSQCEKHRDGRSSRGHASGSSNIKHNRDENKHPENHSKRGRIEENGQESSPYDEYTMKYRDNREKKSFSDDIDYDPKPLNTKVLCAVETNIFDSCKSEVADDRGRSETAIIKSCADNDRPVKSSKWSSQVVKNEYRSLKWAEATHDMSWWSEEQQSIDPSGHSSHESMKCTNFSVGELDSPSVDRKPTPKEHLHDDFLLGNISATSHLQTTPRSDGYSSPTAPSERVHSSSSGRRYSKKKNEMHHFDVEVEQRTNCSKDGIGYATKENKVRDFRFEKQEAVTASSQMELLNDDSVPVDSVSWNRTDPLSRCSPNPLRTSSVSGMGSPVSGSDGDRCQAGDQKSSICYRRAGEINIERGHGNAMKGVLGWPSPVQNGFIPFQHGPPPGGFYPVVQPFPAPVFGIRPPMDLNQSGNPFLMNENSDRFSGHNRPFVWQNTVNDPFPPDLQRWDGNNIFSNGPYMHCRSDWNDKTHLINNSGSEMSSELLKRQNGSMSFPYLASNREATPSVHVMDDELRTGKSSHQPSNEQSKPELKGGKGTNDNHTEKNSKEISQKITIDKTSEATKLSDGVGVAFYCTCLAKLDISPDLACPELYNKWTTSVENKGNKTDDDIMSKNDGVKLAVGISSRAGKLLFPALSDDFFQRAMSLCRKNEMKTGTHSNLPSKGMVSDAEKVVPDENTCKTDLLATDNTYSDVEEDANKLGDPIAGQGGLPTEADNHFVEPKMVEGDLPSVTHDGQSNIIYSTAGCVEGAAHPDGQSNITYNAAGFVEGPLGCEVLMQECRVNLSRIHHSPESTH